MARIKICGLSRIQDIQAVNAAQVDYAGFIFAASKRQVSIEQAVKLRAALAADILAVGVFVNAEPLYIMQAVAQGIIDIIQLHGQEDECYIANLCSLTKLPIIKAFGVSSSADIAAAEQCSADYILLDYKQAGSGQSFDWQLLQGIKRKFFLAGGLNIDNIDAALREQAFALDISSGVETNSYKDADKIQQLVRRIRNEQR